MLISICRGVFHSSFRTLISKFDFPQPYHRSWSRQSSDPFESPAIAKPKGLASLHIALARIQPTKRAAKDTLTQTLYTDSYNGPPITTTIHSSLPPLIPPSPLFNPLPLLYTVQLIIWTNFASPETQPRSSTDLAAHKISPRSTPPSTWLVQCTPSIYRP